MRLGGPKSSSDFGGAQKNPCLLGTEPLLTASSQALYSLSYPSSCNNLLFIFYLLR
jgi:hypothetical protein